MHLNNFRSIINNSLPEPFFLNDSFLILVNCISNNRVLQLNYNYINFNDFSIINNVDLVKINLKIYNNFLNIEIDFTINNNLSGNVIYEVIENSLKVSQQIDVIKQLTLNNELTIEKNNNILILKNDDIILVEVLDDILNLNLNNNLNNSFLNLEYNLLDTNDDFDNLNNLIDFLELLDELNNDDNLSQNQTLNINEFNNLTKTKYEFIKNETTYNICQICQDEQEFKDDDELLILPCKHLFHYNCLKKWLLEYNNSCPLCRYHLSIS